ncbi:type IV pilus assembly protein PilV [Acinetobacter calcoaceticus]|uniref:Type IV pilus assembly protein PilV n=1 Tax=Acinetobacter calcoaceticus TaxID=471 RepID=A0A4R1Y1J0_ACICA|nr:type IV pilus assembly protein PilV [Acinetobacter calcoaceticus]
MLKQRLAVQRGVGMVEVMVALSLLAIAVLGYSALQLRAMAATEEATQHIQAMNLARDLAERMRINRDGFAFYRSVTGTARSCAATANESIYEASGFCSAKQMAEYDFAQVSKKAKLLGMKVAIHDCQNNRLKRQCIYVAWGDTMPTNGDLATDCTRGAAYVSHSTCIIVESYIQMQQTQRMR